MGQVRSARLHIVTGKGGVGKTTTSAALALALCRGGKKTLLVEVEGRQAIAQLFGCGPLPYEERIIATVPDGGEVVALAIDAEQALLEYLDISYRLGVAGKALRKIGAIDFATTIAPGLRDILLTGKIKEAVTRTVDGRRCYDAVILDAPPTGRIGRFLNVTAETAKLAKVGPVKSGSEKVAAILRSPMTSTHLVTILEEMPVQESLDTMDELRHLGIPTGMVIVNSTWDSHLTMVKVTKAELRRGLTTAGLPCDRGTIEGLTAETQAYQAKITAQLSLRHDLRALGRPLVELPALRDGVNREGLDVLATTFHKKIFG